MESARARVQPTSPHFRIVLPEYLRGTRHVARPAKIFLTLPGHSEVEIPSIKWVKSEWQVDAATTVTIRFLGSVEVTYE